MLKAQDTKLDELNEIKDLIAMNVITVTRLIVMCFLLTVIVVVLA